VIAASIRIETPRVWEGFSLELVRSVKALLQPEKTHVTDSKNEEAPGLGRCWSSPSVHQTESPVAVFEHFDQVVVPMGYSFIHQT
jgi:hypothetical protein